jgi:anti-anti-sigma factor
VRIREFVTDDDVAVVALTGRLDLEAAPKVQSALLRRLADRPRGVVVDLVGVQAVDPVCAAVFSAVAHPATRWPGTTVVLCRPWAPIAEVLTSSAESRFLPVRDTLQQALTLARGAQPPWQQHAFCPGQAVRPACSTAASSRFTGPSMPYRSARSASRFWSGGCGSLAW